jgi:AMMECR1 domain-containing protein
MNNDEIKKLKELCEKATLGPWLCHETNTYMYIEEDGLHRTIPATTLDNEFIAAAREAIPRLIEALEKERSEKERLESWKRNFIAGRR